MSHSCMPCLSRTGKNSAIDRARSDHPRQKRPPLGDGGLPCSRNREHTSGGWVSWISNQSHSGTARGIDLDQYRAAKVAHAALSSVSCAGFLHVAAEKVVEGRSNNGD